ncbi:MAG: hypothetical protein HYY30_12540 [Chloroflexi bacterium]|nr:hypothetical protein [Chloroflexota bacterium]
MPETIYFSKLSAENTDVVMKAAASRADELGIKRILVATSTGETGKKALQFFEGRRLVAVTHSTGFHEPNVQDMPEETRAELERHGVRVLTCQHAFGGVGRAVRRKFGTYQVDEIMANTLKIFGAGTKVAVEITMMATDAGLIRTDEEVISIAGTNHGCDTALVIRPANAMSFFELRVREVICKPRY